MTKTLQNYFFLILFFFSSEILLVKKKVYLFVELIGLQEFKSQTCPLHVFMFLQHFNNVLKVKC
jgi:hypothetical protein